MKKPKYNQTRLPLYDIEINDDDITGIQFISIVSKPAIEIKGIAFSEDEEDEYEDADCSDLHEHNFEIECDAPPCHPNCYSSDTTLMTKNGLKLIKDVKIGEEVLSINPDTQNPEWVRCIKTFKVYGEKAIYIHNNNTKMLVSENHPFFGYQRQGWGKKGENRKLKPKKVYSYKDLSSDFKFYKSSKWIGEDLKSININGLEIDIISYLKLMGYYLSEGSTSVTKRGEGILQSTISQEKYLEIFKQDMEKIDVKWWFGKKSIITTDVRLTSYLNQFGKSYEKYVPDIIKTLTPELIDIFLDAYCLGDGSHRKGKFWKGYQFNDSRSYFTSSIRMRDDLMELIVKNNESVSIKKIANKGDECFDGKYKINNDVWAINELRNNYSAIGNMKCDIVDYNDWFYDIEVDKNNTLFIEYKGTTHWGSNCVCFIDQRGYWQNKPFATKSGVCALCKANKKRYNKKLYGKRVNENMAFAVKEEQQILAGPTMVPYKNIYRSDESGEYMVRFTPETIKKIVQKFFKNNNNWSINVEHTNEMVQGYIVEHWIVEDSVYDKSKLYGFNLPVGSHFMLVKIEDEKFWQEQIKGENKTGFSIEGLLGQSLVVLSKIEKDLDMDEFIDSLNEKEMIDILSVIWNK